MNLFKIRLKNIQHIKQLEYEIDLSKNSLHCIVGKNGVGKTTLIKAIENFKESNTLDKLSRINIIQANSEITYTVNEIKYKFTSSLDNDRYILDTKETPSQGYKDNIYTELPIPIGRRFDTYEKLGGSIGEAIKTSFALGTYSDKPVELIKILHDIYDNDKFNNIEEISIQNTKYYIKPLSAENYIREDDFSSGEYMLIQIYKLIKTGCKLIVIDELDISLDSSAQVNFIKELRKLTNLYELNIIFTTHSLAIMKVMEDSELYYMGKKDDDIIIIENKSYNYIKSLLFQFDGHDKIILTEDKMLKAYLEHLLSSNSSIHFKYEIIYIAGASQVVDLMFRNREANFFNTKIVMSFLDGDKRSDYSEQDNIEFLPFESIEKEIYRLYKENKLDAQVTDKALLEVKLSETKQNGNSLSDKAKAKIVIDNLGFNYSQCINFVTDENQDKTEEIKQKIINFLQ